MVNVSPTFRAVRIIEMKSGELILESEQWGTDLEWFASDKSGRIACFTTGGFRLLPSKVAESRADLNVLREYFNDLELDQGFLFCPELKNHIGNRAEADVAKIGAAYGPFSQRGLYSYDSLDQSHEVRLYFRVTLPQRELFVDELPERIKSILETLKLTEIDFADHSLIFDNSIGKM